MTDGFIPILQDRVTDEDAEIQAGKNGAIRNRKSKIENWY
jgi:hypothetical protein